MLVESGGRMSYIDVHRAFCLDSNVVQLLFVQAAWFTIML